MNILTGHKGFIGSHLHKLLPDSLVLEKEQCFSFLNDFKDWDKVDCVYHIGGISSTTETNLELIYNLNVRFTLDLFDKCIQYGIPVKYASSASVYGNSVNRINPLNYYALSKCIVDYWVQDNFDKFKFVQGFRFFNVYGENEEHKKGQASPVTQFSNQAKQTGKILVFEGSESFYRDFICVEDVCQIILHNKLSSGIHDLGTSNPISFLKVAKLIQKKFGGTISEIKFPKHLEGKYQMYTCSSTDYDYKFKTVEEWLDK